MIKRILIVILLMSLSFIYADDLSMLNDDILVSDIPITYGDESFRERILEKTNGERDPIGLVLTGGSARAFAHLGVLKYLEEQGIVPDFIVSNSMGSIIGMLYAAGMTPEQIVEFIEAGDLSNYFSFTLPLKGGLLMPTGFKTLIESAVGVDTRLEDLDIPVMVVCDDLVTKREIRITEGDFADVLIASFALPVYFPPQVYNGHLLTDGGIVSLAPIDAAFEYTDTVILSTTFYDMDGMELVNPITILNSAFDIGKRQKAASDMKKNPDFIWIRCAVEQYSFMAFSKAHEMAIIGYESAKQEDERLQTLYKAGVSDAMLEARSQYDKKIDKIFKNLDYFSRIETSSPATMLGISFDSKQDADYSFRLKNSMDIGLEYNFLYKSIEASVDFGVSCNTLNQSSMHAYPMIAGSFRYYPANSMRFTFDCSFDFGQSKWYIPLLYVRQGYDWVALAKEDQYKLAFKESMEFATRFNSENEFALSVALDGNVRIGWFHLFGSFGYLLTTEGIAFENPRNFLEASVNSRFYLLDSIPLYIDAGLFSRFSVDGQGSVPLFISDGFTSNALMPGMDYRNNIQADKHISMANIAFGLRLWKNPTFGEFLILEDSEIDVYYDSMVHDASYEFSTGAEFQTVFSFIGLVKIPMRLRLGYDSLSNGFVSSLLFSVKH